MSEIKGQLFGILLVILIFAAVGGVLASAFVNATDNVVNKIDADHKIDAAENLPNYPTKEI